MSTQIVISEHDLPTWMKRARRGFNWGVLLVMKGLVEQAEREFETARSLGPGGPAPDVALAMAWMQSGNAGRAVDLLRESTKAGAREAVVPYMLGIALMRTGIDAAAPEGAEAIAALRSFNGSVRT